MSVLTAALALSVALAEIAFAGPPTPHVYLVVVDGLGADALDPTVMPRLTSLAGTDGVRAEARAAMPTRTNPNHVTLLTGLFPESHGVTGNGYWDRTARRARGLDAAEAIEAETLFTVAETTRPALVTMGAFSKAKLGRLFAAAPGRQRGPDVLWAPAAEEGGSHVFGVASDGETMDAFLAAAAEREPDLAAINLSEVDRTAHAEGPQATGEARRHADAAIGRLVDDLHARGRWDRSVVIVTADHGFDDVRPTPERPEPTIGLAERFAAAGVSGVHVVSDGGVAHVYADGIGAKTIDARGAATALGWAAAVAWREPGVAEVLARLPVPGVPTLADVHPDWGLGNERVGDLVIVAGPGYEFVDAPDPVSGGFRGNHGSPREMRVPLVLTGGALDATRVALVAPPSSADVGATIGVLLGLRSPRRFDGQAVRAGHALALPLRAAPQSPH
jgi:arylsulfatase A-like enzyme